MRQPIVDILENTICYNSFFSEQFLRVKELKKYQFHSKWTAAMMWWKGHWRKMTDFCEIQPLPHTHSFSSLPCTQVSSHAVFPALNVTAASSLPGAIGKASLTPPPCPHLTPTGCFQRSVVTLDLLIMSSSIHCTICSTRHYFRHMYHSGCIVKLMKVKLHGPSLTCILLKSWEGP